MLMISCKNCKYSCIEDVNSLTVHCSKFNKSKFHADGCGHFEEKNENVDKVIDTNENPDILIA